MATRYYIGGQKMLTVDRQKIVNLTSSVYNVYLKTGEIVQITPEKGDIPPHTSGRFYIVTPEKADRLTSGGKRRNDLLIPGEPKVGRGGTQIVYFYQYGRSRDQKIQILIR